MRLSTQVKPISYLKNHAAEVIGTLTENREPMLKVMRMHRDAAYALLKILAMGNREIEAGRFRTAEQIFADLDKV